MTTSFRLPVERSSTATQRDGSRTRHKIMTPDPVLVRANHAGPKFVENLAGGLVARQSELPLELDSRHARRLAGDQVGRPEPHRERRVRAFHNGAGSEACITAAKYPRARGNVPWLVSLPAVRTDESIVPSCVLKIGSARRFIRKEVLELRQRAR